MGTTGRGPGLRHLRERSLFMAGGANRGGGAASSMNTLEEAESAKMVGLYL